MTSTRYRFKCSGNNASGQCVNRQSQIESEASAILCISFATKLPKITSRDKEGLLPVHPDLPTCRMTPRMFALDCSRGHGIFEIALRKKSRDARPKQHASTAIALAENGKESQRKRSNKKRGLRCSKSRG